MSAILKNGVQYAGAIHPSSEVLADYVTKTELNTKMGNVDNTADSEKSVLYAATAENATTCSTHTVGSNVPSSPVLTDTTYTLQRNGHTLTLTDSNGNSMSCTVPDENTTYTDLSDFLNDVGYITNLTDTLTNYYKSSETYTQSEIDTLVAGIPTLKIQVVPSLLIPEPDETTIYLLQNVTPETNNLFTEYIYLYDESTQTGTFERLGAQDIDLSAYYQKDDVDDLLDLKGDSFTYDDETGLLELKSDGTTISYATVRPGGTVVRLNDVSGASRTVTHTSATFVWTDPTDVVVDGITLAGWAGTKLVRKVGSAPTSISDGTVVVNSTVRNQYSSSGYTDTGLSYDTTYYYRFFPYTSDNVVTDGSTLTVTPERTVIATVPTFTTTMTYDGTEQTATFSGFDSTMMTISGNTGTNAGDYTAIITPKSDYCWSDYTTTGKNVSWNIGKAAGSITLSANSVTLDSTHLTVTVNVTACTGSVTGVSSNNTEVATTSYANNVITINSVDETKGNAIITVTYNANSNYLGGTKNVSVTANFLKLVTWADGTDAEILDMVREADKKKIDLTEYWSVGDERAIQLSAITTYPTNLDETYAAQDAILVLVASDTKTSSVTTNPCYNYTYSTRISQRTYPSFIFQLKDCMTSSSMYGGGMMDSKTSSGSSRSWEACARRAWCNDQFMNAFPSSLVSTTASLTTVKQVKVKSFFTSTSITTDDYFFLPAAKEIDINGYTACNNEINGLCTWQYYRTTSNRVKNWAGKTYAARWWLRTNFADSNEFSIVTNSSPYNLNEQPANNYAGVAVAGCI